MIVATVESDMHDIGKGICCSLLKTTGIEVYDLGREISKDSGVMLVVADARFNMGNFG